MVVVETLRDVRIDFFCLKTNIDIRFKPEVFNSEVRLEGALEGTGIGRPSRFDPRFIVSLFYIYLLQWDERSSCACALNIDH